MKVARSSGGLRVQSPSLTQEKKSPRSRFDAGDSRQARRDLIGIVREAGVGRQRVNRCVDEIQRLTDVMREIEARAVSDVIRGWL